MYEFGLSRKQCGVIFKAYKNGDINVSEEMIKWMYDSIAERKVLANSANAEYLKTMKYCLEYIFDSNYDEAERAFNNAYGRYMASRVQ